MRIVVAVYVLAVAVALQRRIAGDEAAPLGTVLPAPDRVVVSACGDDRIDVLDPGTGDVTTCRVLTWDLLLGWASAADERVR